MRASFCSSRWKNFLKPFDVPTMTLWMRCVIGLKIPSSVQVFFCLFFFFFKWGWWGWLMTSFERIIGMNSFHPNLSCWAEGNAKAGRWRDTSQARLPALPLFRSSGPADYFITPSTSRFSAPAQLNIRSRPPPCPHLAPPTGGRRRRGLAVADRDLLPQPADAEGRQEPAGRLRRPLSGVRAGAFARRGGGARRSPSPVGERRQHLRRIGRRTVRRRRSTRSARK